MNISKYIFKHGLQHYKSINNYSYYELMDKISYYKDKYKYVNKHDRVIISGKKSIDYVASLFSIWEKKGIVIPIPTLTESIVVKTNPKLIIENDEVIHVNVKAKEIVDLHNTATILFSSGTTSDPKGILLSHENIINNLEMIDKRFNSTITMNDKSFSILPWHHCYGLVCELLYLLSKGSNIVIPSFQSSPKDMMNEIKWVHPTLLFTVPKMLDTIKKKDISFLPFSLKKRLIFGNKLRMMSVGGSVCSLDTLKFITNNYEIPVYQGYGMTECGPMISLNSISDNRLGSVGKPLDRVNVLLNNMNEIMVGSPSLMIGELIRIRDSLEYLPPNRYFATGDKGYLDKDGYLYINGRIKHEFKLTNGKYINPIHLETLILQIPYIEQIIIIPSQDSNSLITLIYSPKQKEINIIKSDILKKLRHVHYYEIPKEFFLLKEPFSIDNQCLSLKLDLRRHYIIDQFYKGKIKTD